MLSKKITGHICDSAKHLEPVSNQCRYYLWSHYIANIQQYVHYYLINQIRKLTNNLTSYEQRQLDLGTISEILKFKDGYYRKNYSYNTNS